MAVGMDSPHGMAGRHVDMLIGPKGMECLVNLFALRNKIKRQTAVHPITTPLSHSPTPPGQLTRVHYALFGKGSWLANNLPCLDLSSVQKPCRALERAAGRSGETEPERGRFFALHFCCWLHAQAAGIFSLSPHGFLTSYFLL